MIPHPTPLGVEGPKWDKSGNMSLAKMGSEDVRKYLFPFLLFAVVETVQTADHLTFVGIPADVRSLGGF